MTTTADNGGPAPSPRRKAGVKRRWKVLAVIALLALSGYWLLGGGEDAVQGGTTYTVNRGTLTITVLEGGSIEAKESQEIKSEVQGQTKILSIVEEGYLVTPEDVENGKILVELDSKDLLDKQVEQELQYQNSLASLTEATEQYEIQINQNQSDIKAAELLVRFARMDFEKYLGVKVAEEIISELGLDMEVLEQPLPVVTQPEEVSFQPSMDDYLGEWALSMQFRDRPMNLKLKIGEAEGKTSALLTAPGLAPAAVEDIALDDSGLELAYTMDFHGQPMEMSLLLRSDGLTGNGVLSDASGMFSAEIEGTRKPPPAAVQDAAPSLQEAAANPVPSHAAIDFSKYADPDLLGDGEARQKLRKLEDDFVLSEEEVGLSQSKLDGTKRLYDREFVTKTELENDTITLKRKDINRQSAETAKALFIKYEFPKEAEKLLSDYEEALRKLVRARKLAVSKLAQAEAKKNSAEARHKLQTRKRDEIREQIEKCVIKATKPGLVVYGGGRERYYREERIEEGATVRERQVIITIPDTTTMTVDVKVHESFVKRVKKGQRARIRVDAYPDQQLTGTVEKIGVLPDSQNRWMNPDLKVYTTTIVIDGTHDWLKPGMSSEAEIIIDELPDVLQVPLQAVSPSNGEQVCYVANSFGAERRVVKTGAFSESFIEITHGLEVGEVVLLRAPEGMEETGEEKPAEEAAETTANRDEAKAQQKDVST